MAKAKQRWEITHDREATAMPDILALVMDCGSTNITVSAVDSAGRIVGSATRANGPEPDESGRPSWFVWDLDRIMERIGEASREATANLGDAQIVALAVTTWGADGAPVDGAGQLTHPIVSWQCGRTEDLAASFASIHDPYEAYRVTGYQVLPFNTLLKLIWLRRNVPGALDRAETFMMMPGLISHRLTGEVSIDATSAGTTMAVDLSRRSWAPELLAHADVAPDLFPRWVEPGEVIGGLTSAAATELGLPAGIPVVAAGHDTQFAAVGSGAAPGEAVLSSGTWEILMARTECPALTRELFDGGLIVELDPVPGLTNPQFLMMGSGALEWVRERLYDDIGDRRAAYRQMIEEAQSVPPGCEGLTALPQFQAGSGPSKRYGTGGGLLGLDLQTTRGQIYRAMLEGLALQLRHALDILGQLQASDVGAVRVVGGGSRNALWNQIRADVCGVPVATLEQKEATVMGAAIFAFLGAGVFGSIEEARSAVTVGASYEPSADSAAYQELYGRYSNLLPSLQDYFGAQP
jgi:L-fuculokinase